MAGRHHRFGKGECSRCGFIFKLNHLRYEYSGYKVCASCWDPLPAQDYPRAFKAEQEGLHDPRPEHDLLVSNGRIRGLYEIIGRDWIGTDLNITGGEAPLR